MNWHDLLYFSKGERRALTVLSTLIATAWLLLVLADSPLLSSEEIRQTELSSPSSERKKTIVPSTSPTGSTNPSYPRQKAQPITGKKSSPPTSSSSHPTHSSFRTSPSATAFSRKTSSYPVTRKLPAGTLVELNTADTSLLKQVPGIGNVFARRIVKYRNLLGGFYSIRQLGEVYGIDEQRYEQLKSWFSVDPAEVRPFSLHTLATDSAFRHPYLSYRQLRALRRLLKQKGRLSGWANIQLLEEFSDYDRERLTPYLSFE